MIAWLYRIWARLLVWLRIGRRDTLWYVHANESLPPPLDPEEEARCIELAPTDKEAKDKLIVHNLRLVVYLAKKFENTGVQTEDLISIGTIGLIKAVETFKSEKKIKLATYASRCIENEILMHLRRERKLVETVSIEEPVGADKEGNELRLADLVCTEADTIFEQVQGRLDAAILTDTMRKVLTKRERVVLTLRFGLSGNAPMAQREVANVLDISRSYVSRIEKKAVEKMREALGGDGGRQD